MSSSGMDHTVPGTGGASREVVEGTNHFTFVIGLGAVVVAPTAC